MLYYGRMSLLYKKVFQIVLMSFNYFSCFMREQRRFCRFKRPIWRIWRSKPVNSLLCHLTFKSPSFSLSTFIIPHHLNFFPCQQLHHHCCQQWCLALKFLLWALVLFCFFWNKVDRAPLEMLVSQINFWSIETNE